MLRPATLDHDSNTLYIEYKYAVEKRVDIVRREMRM
jgi:hypothetical protein